MIFGKMAMRLHIVILSKLSTNLITCVRSIFAQDSAIIPRNIIVVDDGAQEHAGRELSTLRWIAGNKPFVFARNANLGIITAGTDVILLNDDTRLLTPCGFTRWAAQLQQQRFSGICSAAILGTVGNYNQHVGGLTGHPMTDLRPEPTSLAFICVYIPWAAYCLLGPLDEQFIGYGCEDSDYCVRASRAGLPLAVWDGCVVRHQGVSTFLVHPPMDGAAEHNLRLFHAKYAE